MRLFPAFHNRTPVVTGLSPALQGFADECAAVTVRLVAYMGALGVIVVAAVTTLDGLQLDLRPAVAPTPTWSLAPRPSSAFAVRQPEPPGVQTSYEIQRHPLGGRKDILRWTAADGAPLAELEILRLEARPDLVPADDLADRLQTSRGLVSAGILTTKFGPVALFDPGDRPDGRHCLGFTRGPDGIGLRMSGFTCLGETLPARRTAVACMLDGLVLLTAGREARLAEWFAHAELRRAGCPAAATTGADWVASAANPPLRGSL